MTKKARIDDWVEYNAKDGPNGLVRYPIVNSESSKNSSEIESGVYFTKNPAQKEAVAVVSVYRDDNARVQYLRELIKPEAGNDFVTRALGT